MATATAPGPIAPISEWDPTETEEYTTPAYVADGAAWTLLTHSQAFGPDLAHVRWMKAKTMPAGMEAEDWYGFLFELVGEAGRIGYTVAQIKTSGFALPWDGAKLRTSDVARAVAALLRMDVIEDDQFFDPEYRAKLDAEWSA